MRSVEEMVQQEVQLCLSAMVSILASGYGRGFAGEGSSERAGLAEQASELSYPVEDWEEAAIQEGWSVGGTRDGMPTFFKNSDGRKVEASGWQELCEEVDIDPYEREVFEHWAVSKWLAEKLAAKGERVDMDFAGLCVWGRTTTGQSISMDGVIQEIHAEAAARYAAMVAEMDAKRAKG